MFNRLVNSKLAIVSNIPGTTRDRNLSTGYIAGLKIEVIDTGGLDDRGQVFETVQKQVDLAVKMSDVILFLVDAKVGVTSLDAHFANWIRRRLNPSKSAKSAPASAPDSPDTPSVPIKSKKMFLLANKTEGMMLSDRMLDTVSDALELGLGEPMLISSSHGDGMVDLAQALIASARDLGLDTEEDPDAQRMLGPIKVEERTIQLAVMGRPNVGKSSFVNAVLGEERVIVGPTPGLTRCVIQGHATAVCIYDFVSLTLSP